MSPDDTHTSIEASVPKAFGFFLLFMVLFSLVIFWIPRSVGMSIEGSMDTYSYVRDVVDEIDDAQVRQPFLATYVRVNPWIAPELFAPAFHLAIVLPALLLLARCRYGQSLLPAVMAALLFPEFLLFLSSVTKEGLAISAMVWLVAAFALLRSGSKVGALFALAVATAVCEMSRPFFSLVLWGALLLAGLLAANLRYKLVLFCTATLALMLVHVSTPALAQAWDAAGDKANAAMEFLRWFEENLQSESATKDFVRKALSLRILEIESPILLTLAASLGLAVKTLVYTFGIPLVGMPPLAATTQFSWAMIWQFAASLTSLVLLAAAYSYGRRSHWSVPGPERLGVAFAVVFAFSIAASTLFFHVRYRAPAEYLLLVIAMRIVPLSPRALGLAGVANGACLGIGGLAALPHLT